MAEYGAHLTSTTAATSRPSIFEVLAQDNLTASIRPAIKHIIKVLADRNPVRFSLLYRFSDEIYLILNGLLEHIYLKKYGASFAEEFYSLHRKVKQTNNQSNPGLPMKNRIKSLIFIALFPYLQHKFDEIYEKLLYETQDWNQRSYKSIHMRLCLIFVAVYPYVHGLLEAVTFCCQLLYVFGRIDFHSFLLPLAGVRLTWNRDEYLSQFHKEKEKSPDNFYERIVFFLNSSKGFITTAVTSSLTTGVFFLQFMEWWYSSDQSHNLDVLPCPPPPKKDKEMYTGNGAICPICHRNRTNDTALSVTGYVFCYPCIYKYVSKNNRCPITGYPANSSHLIRIYKDEL